MAKLDVSLAMVLEEHNIQYCKSCGKMFDRNDIVFRTVKDGDTNRSVVEIICSECFFRAAECISWYPSVSTLRQAITILDEELEIAN